MFARLLLFDCLGGADFAEERAKVAISDNSGAKEESSGGGLQKI